jgi:hypothetical protein
MQRAQSTATTPIHFQPQATRVLPGHGTGAFEDAVNDAEYLAEDSSLQTVLAIAGNVIGGAVLLAMMLALPYLVSALLG